MKLGMPTKKKNLSPVPTMAIITKETIQIYGVEKNTKSLMKMLWQQLVQSVWREEQRPTKGKGARFNIVFYSPTISDNEVLFKKSSSSKSKTRKDNFLYYPFFL